jgi:hypothetical protein
MNYNGWKLHIKNPCRAKDFGTMEHVWKGALTILNGEDRDYRQQLVRDLDHLDLHGRQHMQLLLSMNAHTIEASTFIKVARPFLLVISHKELLNCLAVDTAVGAIYNFISGNNGTRAIPFLQALLGNLNDIHNKPNPPVTMSVLEETFTAASITLQELLRREQRALFNDDLPGLVADFEEFAKAFAANRPAITFHTNSIFAGLQGMIARALGLLHYEEPTVNGISTTTFNCNYLQDLRLPGDRHDNDKLDITEIQILPTESEIKSEHEEFLPSTDRDQPHFLTDPTLRHIDTNFRLYRHDIFGALKDNIGGFMLAVEKNPDLLNAPRLTIGDIRPSYIFHNAHISNIKMSKPRDLEAYITFTQPPPLRHSTSLDRRRFWDETRRLNAGNLLCHISYNGTKTSLLFFIVNDKEVSQNKVGVVSDPEWATIHLKLATRSQTDFELMTQLRCEGIKGILVELPGVIPGTFIPVLENLQHMQRQSRLPFREWILPNPATNNEPLVIPPPLYAQGKDFQFSLRPLLTDGDDDLLIDAEMSQQDILDEIEDRTPLDRGQCEALVAALTREFAFIQGPPGTGKSYLGVALMKVLLGCAEKEGLGPILVVTYSMSKFALVFRSFSGATLLNY